MPLSTEDIVTHFIFSKRRIRRVKNHSDQSEIYIAPEAFEPHKDRNDLSAFRISDLKLTSDDRSIWFIGKFVEKQRHDNDRPENMHGRGDLYVSQILDLSLSVSEQVPPPRHANVTLFPPFNRNKESESYSIQQKLADRAEGFLSKEMLPDIANILSEDVAVKAEFSAPHT